MVWLLAPNLAQFPWLRHAFSTRQGGASKPPASGLHLGGAGANQARDVLRNRRLFYEAVGADEFLPASLQQIHSADIYAVARQGGRRLEYKPAGYERRSLPSSSPACCGDALMTSEPRVLLCVRAADCLPVLLVDAELRVVAAIHAGWRGALQRIVEKTIGEMRRLYGSNPRRLHAALGPCILPCCYEVGEEVMDAFSGRFINSGKFFHKPTDSGAGGRAFERIPFLSMMPPGHDRPSGSGLCLDLVLVALDQLRSAGVPASHTDVAGYCTSCHTDLFFSHRKEGSAAGRMMAVIGVRP